jgi:hypothetical protein
VYLRDGNLEAQGWAMMKRTILKSLLVALAAGFAALPAMASSVTYNFEADDGIAGGFMFTGSFLFDTSTDTISNESLQSTDTAVENWTPVAQPYSFYGLSEGGAPGSPAAFDLFFHSPSAAFPSSPGDIVGFSFYELGTNFLHQSLDGVSPAGIFGLYYGTYDYPPSPPAPFDLFDAYVQGCVTPGPACSSVAATPLLSTWLLLLSGLVGFGFVAYRRSKKSAAALAAA